MRRLVLDLRAQRPVWRMPDWLPERVAARLGPAWEVAVVSAATSSDADGGGESEEAVACAAGAEVYVGFGLPSRVFDAARATLRWVHSGAAGVGSSIPLLLGTDIVMTNSAGIHAEPIADWVLASILHYSRGLDIAVRAQQERRWDKDAFTEGRVAFPELTQLRVAVLGLGGIGQAVARRCVALGMRVTGLRRRPDRGGPASVLVEPPERLVTVAAESDVLVIATPLTADTVNIVDARILGQLPPGAVVINASRGKCLDEATLLALLSQERLRGAALDVFHEEPLPPEHAFWEHPRVLVTPHTSEVTSRFWEREAELIITNVDRYLSGAPLRNLVDYDAGY